MKTLFIAVKEVVEKIPEIKWFDWDFDQLTAFEIPPVAYPCVLFSVQNAEVMDNKNEQEFDTVFRIRIGFKVLQKANSKDPLYAEQALQHLDMIRLVYDAIQTIEADEFSNPQLINIRPGNRVDPRYWDCTFGTNVYEWPEPVKNIKVKMSLKSLGPMELDVDVVPPEG